MLSPASNKVFSWPFSRIGKPPIPEAEKKREMEVINKGDTNKDSMENIAENVVKESVKEDDEHVSDLKEKEEEKVDNNDVPQLKVMIRDFAKQTNAMSESQTVDIEKMASEELSSIHEEQQESEDDSDSLEEIEEPVSPPPSEPNDVIIVEDDEERPNIKEEDNNNTGSGTGVAVAALIRRLLQSASGPVVRWEDAARGEFRVLSPTLLAKHIQQSNPSQPIAALRCDRGVFESVPGKSLVFRFGDTIATSPTPSPRRTPTPPTPVLLTPKLLPSLLQTTHLPAVPKRSPQKGGRKTYAQKISELQKPIPGQTTSVSLETSQDAKALPALPTLTVSRPAGVPALIPLTVDDMARKDAASTINGLHLSGGGVSDFSLPRLTPLPLARHLSQQDVPQLEPFLSREVSPSPLLSIPEPVEMPLDLSGGTSKRRMEEIGLEDEPKKPRYELVATEDKRMPPRVTTKIRAGKKQGRNSSTEEEMVALWTFCRAALHNPDYNPKVISWEKIEDGEFRIINQEEFLRAWLHVKGTHLQKDGLKRRVRACEDARVMHSRPHTRLGYRFGEMAADWRPLQGELVEQGKKMVPSKVAWFNSRFFHEFNKNSWETKKMRKVKIEPTLENFDTKKEVKETLVTTSSPPLFTLTPLVKLDLPPMAEEYKDPVAETKAEAEADEVETKNGPAGIKTEETIQGGEEGTECAEFSCRLVLPRHRGYLPKLRLGDGLTIPLDRQVFAQIEEAMREALKVKIGKSRVSAQDRTIANAIIRKAKRQVRAGKKVNQVANTAVVTEEVEDQDEDVKSTISEESNSMPILEIEEEMVDGAETSETDEKPAERDTASPPEARHRLPFMVPQREATQAFKRSPLKVLPQSTPVSSPGV